MDVRLPDGTVIRGVPDGMSKADLTAKLANNGYDVSKLGGPVSGPDAIPTPRGSRPAEPVASAAPSSSAFETVGGIVEPALSTLSGLAGGAIGSIAGAGKSLISGKFGTQEGIQQGQELGGRVAEALTYQPRSETGQRRTQAIGQAFNDSGLAGVPLPELATLGRNAAPAFRAASDIGQSGAAQGGATLAQMARATVPRIDPATARLANIAQEKFDIPLRPDQLYNNRIARVIGEASEKVPLSGSKAIPRQEAFNKAVIGTIGGDEAAVKLTPDVFDAAIRKSGQKIGDIASKTPLPIDSELSNALDSHIANAAKYETSDVARVVNSYIDELRSKAQDGVIPGEAFRKLNTKITTQMRSTSNGDLKNALANVQDDLQDALQRNLTGDDLSALRAARQQYAIAKTIEPLVAKSASGDISPAGLMGRVTANNAGKSRMARGTGGDIGDLARIGQRFLKEPPSSGTAERGLAYGILGGGVATQPAAAGAAYGLSNVYNRTGAALARKLTPTLSDLAGGD